MLRNEAEPLFDFSGAVYREYVMVSTVVTPKLLDLLDMIACCKDGLTQRLASEARKRCVDYQHIARKKAAEETDLPISLLRTAMAVYALYDSVLAVASIQNKIYLFHLSLLVARQQAEGIAPYHLQITDCPISQSDGYIPLTDSEIMDELSDYGDELNAWLDLYFTEEYEEFSNDGKYEEVVHLISDLKMLKNFIAGTFFVKAN